MNVVFFVQNQQSPNMKILQRCIIRTLLLISFACKEDDTSSDPSRSFLMGFTPFPYDVTLEAVQETYSNISKHADIINHHFDNGVPWEEALRGQAFSSNILSDWNFRKGNTPSSSKVLVSVSVLNGERNGLAKYRGQTDDEPLTYPWNTYSFSHPDVRLAYVNYCKRLIEFFNPEYFNMNIEANLLYHNNPTLWNDFVSFHEYVYKELKLSHPNLSIFSSVSGTHLLEGYFDGNDVLAQRVAANQILEFSDLYGISFYPYLSKVLGNPYPSNTFDELFGLNTKPIAIAETGYPAQNFNINMSGVSVSIQSDESKQQQYVEDLMEACSKRDTKLIINFIVRDYDELWKYLGSEENITIAWRDTGFLNEQGKERSGFSVWKNYFKKPLK